MSTPGPDDYVALRAIAERYASGVDQRDPKLFTSAFRPDARLRVFDPSDAETPARERQGHEELARIPDVVAAYDRTFHFLGNSRYDVVGDTATGEVYCMAHHLMRSDNSNRIMYIRYRDDYRRGGDGEWLIATRDVLVDWSESHAVRSWDY
ncbi:MAG: nuclear transport factor 2 family protein [Actinobacteria bacterium]|nr:MAG: nuclear transport factor 2 family protein [Actinomycetota bacterium]